MLAVNMFQWLIQLKLTHGNFAIFMCKHGHNLLKLIKFNNINIIVSDKCVVQYFEIEESSGLFCMSLMSPSSLNEFRLILDSSEFITVHVHLLDVILLAVLTVKFIVQQCFICKKIGAGTDLRSFIFFTI